MNDEKFWTTTSISLNIFASFCVIICAIYQQEESATRCWLYKSKSLDQVVDLGDIVIVIVLPVIGLHDPDSVTYRSLL